MVKSKLRNPVGKNPDNKLVNKREHVSLLPAIHQTDTNKKFFSAAFDHMFQPQNAEELSGYIGEKPTYFDPNIDFYINEPYASRAFYQLTPAVVQTNETDNNIERVFFFEDLLNLLRFQGGDVSKHNRLFAQQFYSWCPPIDVDKLVNFREYYWCPYGYDPYEIDSVTDFDNDIIGKDRYTITLHTGTLTLSSGMRIKILNDINSNYNNRIYIVEGVGREIRIVEDDTFFAAWDLVDWDSNWSWDPNNDDFLTPDYTIMERSSLDKNPWSTFNRWFHRDVIKNFYDEDLIKYQAKRPIIEFERDLELFNYGISRRDDVDLIINNNPNILGTLNGLVEPGWDNYSWDFLGYQDYGITNDDGWDDYSWLGKNI